MSDLAIRVENLGKRYRLGERQPYKTLRESIRNMAALPIKALRREGQKGDEYLWALRDVSFEVNKGEAFGIIGRNGAGKSTLLKVLSRITEPTEGRAEVHGRLGSLLEVGTGFHPELTGRENIYLNGAILGMRKTEIDRKFDEIVEFSEIEKFLDTPVKRYSSGMYVRLAFAVAAHLEPEVLVVDEVLAVGDAAFQKKCLGKMESAAKLGRTVLFVSHNMAAIEALCPQACLFDHGYLKTKGASRDIVQQYLASVNELVDTSLGDRVDRQGSGQLRFTDIRFFSQNGEILPDMMQSGQEIGIVISYRGAKDVLKNVSTSIAVYSIGGQVIMMLNNEMVGDDFTQLPGEGAVVCRLDKLPLSPGQYYLNLYCEVNGIMADWIQQATSVSVQSGDFFGTGRLPPASHGGMLVPHHWSAETSGGRRG